MASPKAIAMISGGAVRRRGLLDEVIPADTAQATRRAYCDAGIATQWTSYAGDHLLGDPQAIADSVNWLTDRFAGKPMQANC